VHLYHVIMFLSQAAVVAQAKAQAVALVVIVIFPARLLAQQLIQ
jgi:hypothetical protein